MAASSPKMVRAPDLAVAKMAASLVDKRQAHCHSDMECRPLKFGVIGWQIQAVAASHGHPEPLDWRAWSSIPNIQTKMTQKGTRTMPRLDGRFPFLAFVLEQLRSFPIAVQCRRPL